MSLPLILIPGIGGDAAVWTGMPAGEVMISDADSIDGMAADILVRTPARFALAGHSMGGYVALAIMAQAPERVGRLALLSTSAAPDTTAQREARRATMNAARDDYPAVVEALLRAMLHPDARADAALVGAMRAMLLRASAKRFLRQQAAALARPDRNGILPDIAVPTLVLHGVDDRIIPPAKAEETASAIPAAWLALLPCCGHSPQIEQPQATRACLSEWLAGESA